MGPRRATAQLAIGASSPTSRGSICSRPTRATPSPFVSRAAMGLAGGGSHLGGCGLDTVRQADAKSAAGAYSDGAHVSFPVRH